MVSKIALYSASNTGFVATITSLPSMFVAATWEDLLFITWDWLVLISIEGGTIIWANKRTNKQTNNEQRTFVAYNRRQSRQYDLLIILRFVFEHLGIVCDDLTHERPRAVLFAKEFGDFSDAIGGDGFVLVGTVVEVVWGGVG